MATYAALVYIYISLSLPLLVSFLLNLREVGPSRKILHVRGVGSERRKKDERVPGSWGALGATRKIKINIYELHFLPLQRRLFLGPSMRPV